MDVYNNVTNNFNVIHNMGFAMNYNEDEYKMVKVYKDLMYHIIPIDLRDYVVNFLDLKEVWNHEMILFKICEFQTL